MTLIENTSNKKENSLALPTSILEIIGYSVLTLGYIIIVSWLYPSPSLALLSFLSVLLYRYGLPWYTAIVLYTFPYIFSPTIEPIFKYVLIGIGTWTGWIIIDTFPKRLKNGERVHRHINPVFCVALAATCVGSTILINAIRVHHNLMTFAFDLGLFDNIFYNISIGNGMLNPMERNNVDQNHFYVHFSPIFYLLSPLYKLGQRAEALIAIQALTVLSSSLALYYLATHLISKKTASIIAICWTIYTPLQGGLFYHFHEVVVGPTILFLIGISLLKGHIILPWLLTLLLASVKEDYPIICIPAILLFGVWSKRLPVASGLAIILIAYFIAIKALWIIPYGENWTGRIYENLGAQTVTELLRITIETPEKILASMWTNLKLFNMLELLVPLGFLALISRWTYAMMAIPLLVLYSPAETVFSSNFFQYTFSTAPFLFLGTLDVLKKWSEEKRLKAAILLLTLGLVVQYNFGILGGKEIRSGFVSFTIPVEIKNKEAYKELQGIIDDIPKEAIVAADDNLAPHISNRSKAYSLKYWDSNTLDNWSEAEKPTYIILNRGNTRFDFRGYRDVYLGQHFKVLKKI